MNEIPHFAMTDGLIIRASRLMGQLRRRERHNGKRKPRPANPCLAKRSRPEKGRSGKTLPFEQGGRYPKDLPQGEPRGTTRSPIAFPGAEAPNLSQG